MNDLFCLNRCISYNTKVVVYRTHHHKEYEGGAYFARKQKTKVQFHCFVWLFQYTFLSRRKIFEIF